MALTTNSGWKILIIPIPSINLTKNKSSNKISRSSSDCKTILIDQVGYNFVIAAALVAYAIR